MNVEQYRKRFYNLMESTMGNVKPLIKEETGPLDRLKIKNLNIKPGNTESSVTLSDNSTYKYSIPLEKTTYMTPNSKCTPGEYVGEKLPDGCMVIITLEDGTNHTCDSMRCKAGYPKEESNK